MCKVSVIVPVYNGEKVLEHTLQSIQSQTLWDIEILCINDGSTDHTAQLIRRKQKEDGRIRYQYQQNQGAGSARNRGIRAARGEFLAFMDADDHYPDRHVLEKLYYAAVKNRAQICGGSVRWEGADPAWNQKNHFLKEGYRFFEEEPMDFLFWRFLFQRSFLEKQKIRFPDLKVYEDPVFLAEAMIAAQKYYVIIEEVYVYSGPHQVHGMNREKVKDYLTGITRELKLSADYGLKKLHRMVFERLEKEAGYYAEQILYLDEGEIFRLLLDADAAIDKALIGVDMSYMLPAIRDVWKGAGKVYRMRNRNIFCLLLHLRHRRAEKQKEKGKRNGTDMDNGHKTEK